MFIVFGVLCMGVVMTFVFLPVFHDLQLTSTYEYLETRFDKKMRLFGSVMFTFGTVSKFGRTKFPYSIIQSNYHLDGLVAYCYICSCIGFQSRWDDAFWLLTGLCQSNIFLHISYWNKRSSNHASRVHRLYILHMCWRSKGCSVDGRCTNHNDVWSNIFGDDQRNDGCWRNWCCVEPCCTGGKNWGAWVRQFLCCHYQVIVIPTSSASTLTLSRDTQFGLYFSVDSRIGWKATQWVRIWFNVICPYPH